MLSVRGLIWHEMEWDQMFLLVPKLNLKLFGGNIIYKYKSTYLGVTRASSSPTITLLLS